MDDWTPPELKVPCSCAVGRRSPRIRAHDKLTFSQRELHLLDPSGSPIWQCTFGRGLSCSVHARLYMAVACTGVELSPR